MKPSVIVTLEAGIAFLLPAMIALASSLMVKSMSYYEATAYLCAAIGAGLSGLKSFLSTTYSDSLPQPTKS